MDFTAIATEVGSALHKKGLYLVTAESCTGGWIAQTVTSVAGSSQWFERSFVTYSNQAKVDMLGVKQQTLQQFGAVSQETAIEMANGALKNSTGDVAIAVTGIAGPDGGTKEKPVGLVWFAFAIRNQTTIAKQKQFVGDRTMIRSEAVMYALQQLIILI